MSSLNLIDVRVFNLERNSRTDGETDVYSVVDLVFEWGTGHRGNIVSKRSFPFDPAWTFREVERQAFCRTLDMVRLAATRDFEALRSGWTENFPDTDRILSDRVPETNKATPILPDGFDLLPPDPHGPKFDALSEGQPQTEFSCRIPAIYFDDGGRESWFDSEVTLNVANSQAIQDHRAAALEAAGRLILSASAIPDGSYFERHASRWEART